MASPISSCAPSPATSHVSLLSMQLRQQSCPVPDDIAELAWNVTADISRAASAQGRLKARHGSARILPAVL